MLDFNATGDDMVDILNATNTMLNATLNETLNAVMDVVVDSVFENIIGDVINMGNDTLANLTATNTTTNSTTTVKKKSRILSDIVGFERMYYWQIYALLSTTGMLTFFALIANGLVIYVLFKHRSLRKSKNFHFFVLLFISLLNSVIYYLYVVLTYTNSTQDIVDGVCVYFYGWAIEVIYNVSMTIMLGMCIERLISVMEPLWYTTVWMDEKYSLWLIIGMLCLGILPVVLPIMAQCVVYHHSRKWMYCRLSGPEGALKGYIWANICLIYFPCIIGVVVVYATVQVKATQARKLSMQYREECKSKNAEMQAAAGKGFNLDKLRSSLYASRVTILLLCIFVGTKLPLAILSYAHLFHMKLPFAVRNCEFIGNLCRFFFSIFTPFLFPLLNTPLKNKLKLLLCSGGKKRKSRLTMKSTDMSYIDTNSHTNSQMNGKSCATNRSTLNSTSQT